MSRSSFRHFTQIVGAQSLLSESPPNSLQREKRSLRRMMRTGLNVLVRIDMPKKHSFTDAIELPSKTSARLLHRRSVLRIIGMHPETLRRWIKSGKFPAPAVRKSREMVFWRESDLASWLEEQ